MKIFATGHEQRITELKQKLHREIFTAADLNRSESLNDFDVIFDLNADEKKMALTPYASCEGKLVVVCAVKKSLLQMIAETPDPLQCHLVGMNALPTFINRCMLEVAFTNDDVRNAFNAFAQSNNLTFQETADHVGMVTPRVICMIINEACCSLQEGVATTEDIDKAMKLGTNYPYGPFEWCDRIGVNNVYETLLAIEQGDDSGRYAMADLLKEKYRSHQTFYPLQNRF